MKQESVFKRRRKIPETLNELTNEVREIMVEHIGVDKEITKGELFKALFGKPNQYNEMQEWYLWDKAKKSMNWLRRTSNCFIASRQTVPKVWAYFVIKTNTDLQFYKNTLNNNIHKMYGMMRRGEKIVRLKAYQKFQEEMGV